MTKTLLQLTLTELPTTIRILFTATLLTLGMGYLFALANVGLAVGLTPVKIVEHYWGNEATRRSLEQDDAPAEQEFSFEEFEAEQGDEPVRPIPSFKSLVAEGHFHLLSYAMIFFICGFIVSFARMPVLGKQVLILAPFVASVFDIGSILLTRFIGPGFAWMVMLSGSVMAVSFALVFGISIYQMWFRRSSAQ